MCIWSIILGLVIAWLIISILNKPVEYFTQAPVIGRELDEENMLIAVGLATRTPPTRSIMDSASTPMPVFAPQPRPTPLPPPTPQPEPEEFVYAPASPQFLAPIPPPMSYVYTPPSPTEIIYTPQPGSTGGGVPGGPSTTPSPQQIGRAHV